jgi:hypothetical protein
LLPGPRLGSGLGGFSGSRTPGSSRLPPHRRDEALEHYEFVPCGPDVALGEVLSENEVAPTLRFSRKIKRPTSSVERGLTDTMRRRMHTDEFPAAHASTFADPDQLFPADHQFRGS